MLVSALALLLALPARAAEAPLLEVVSRRELLSASFIPVTNAAKSVPLSLVVEAGSPWAASGSIERTLGKASAIFARCGFGLGPAEIVVVRWSPEALRRLNDQNPYHGPAQTKVIDEPLLPKGRPVGFLFATGSVPSTAHAYNLAAVAKFAPRHPEVQKLLSTFWITQDYESRRGKDYAPSFSLVAHELAHIFGNVSGHPEARPNLMTNDEAPGSKSGDLLESQCVELRKLHGL